MTNDTTEAIQTSTFAAEHESGPDVPRRERRTRRSRRMAAAVVAGLVAVGVGGALALSGGSDDTAASGTIPVASAEPLAAVAAPPADVPSPGPAPSPGEQPSGDVGTETPDPVPPAPPGHLVVSTTNVVLQTNDFDGSLELSNDGGSDVAWQWMSGHPSIAAAPSGGVLAPGESIVVEFTISWQQLLNGGFIYQNHVVSDEQSIKVIVTGTRDIEVNPEIELPEPELTVLDD